MTVQLNDMYNAPEPDWYREPGTPVAPEGKKVETPKTLPQDQQYQRLKIKYFASLYFNPFSEPVPPQGWYKS